MPIPMTLLLGIIAVVVIVAVGGVVLLTGQHPSNGNVQPSATTTVTAGGGGTPTTTIASQNNGTGGTGQIVLSAAQFSSLMGAGGKYNSTTDLNAQEEAALLAQYAGSNASAYLFQNVTGVWFATYNVSAGNKSALGLEVVFQSKNGGKALYSQMIANTSESNAPPSTLDGLSYVYTGSNQYYLISVLEGYKDSYTAVFYDFGTYVANTTLASTIAGDLP